MGKEKVQLTGATYAWTSRDLARLREHSSLGAREVSALMGRSVACIKAAAHRHGISLRRPGSRRGLVLGQPRGLSLRDERTQCRVSPEVRSLRLALDAAATICPSCGHRPVEVRSTGYCVVCHRRRLIEAHLAEIEKLDSQRALWSSRQALCRARRADS